MLFKKSSWRSAVRKISRQCLKARLPGRVIFKADAVSRKRYKGM